MTLKSIWSFIARFIAAFFILSVILIWISEPDKELGDAVGDAFEETGSMVKNPVEYFTEDITVDDDQTIIEYQGQKYIFDPDDVQVDENTGELLIREDTDVIVTDEEVSDYEEFEEGEFGEYVDERYHEDEEPLKYEQRKYPSYSWQRFVRGREMFTTAIGFAVVSKTESGCITIGQASAIMDNIEVIYDEFVYIKLPQKVKYASDEQQIDAANSWFNNEVEDLMYGYPSCVRGAVPVK